MSFWTEIEGEIGITVLDGDKELSEHMYKHILGDEWEDRPRGSEGGLEFSIENNTIEFSGNLRDFGKDSEDIKKSKDWFIGVIARIKSLPLFIDRAYMLINNQEKVVLIGDNGKSGIDNKVECIEF